LIGDIKWLQRYKTYIPKLIGAISNSKKSEQKFKRNNKMLYLKAVDGLRLQNKLLKDWKDKLAKLKKTYGFKGTDSIDRMIKRLNVRKKQVQKEIDSLESSMKDENLQKRLSRLQK